MIKRLPTPLHFLLSFVRHPIRIGAPFQCTKGISDTVRNELMVHDAKSIIELGAGMGSLTEGIVSALDGHRKPLCVESKSSFCEILFRKFGNRIELAQGNALRVGEIVKGTFWEKPDAIVCSIPLANRDALPLCKTIAELLRPGGLYLQVANCYSAVRAYFNIEKTHFFLCNLPPERLHRAFPKNDAAKGRNKRDKEGEIHA